MKPTIRTVLEAAGVPFDFLSGLTVAGLDLSVTVPTLEESKAKQAPTVQTPGPVMQTTICVLLRSLAQALYNSERIQGIKVVRNTLGLSLKDAKDIVDLFASWDATEGRYRLPFVGQEILKNDPYRTW